MTLALDDAEARLRVQQGEIMLERTALLARCQDDIITQAAIRKLCTYGLPDGTPGYIYWFRNFAYIYEPREIPGRTTMPFVLWDFQEEELKFIHEAITNAQGIRGEPANFAYLKSRDMGMSWLIITYFLWDWMFNGGSYLLISRKQEEVDTIGNMKSLFEKLRWQLRKQPAWLLPAGFVWKTNSKELLIQNPSGGEITGESSNPNAGRGDRRKAVMLDEFASCEYDKEVWKACAGSSYVRFAVSTPKGLYNLFADMCRGKCEEKVTVRTIHWSMHPIKNIDMVTLPDGRLSSPWYERERIRMNPDDIASELDLSFNTSQKGRIFPTYGNGHKRALAPIPGLPIIRAWDPGRTFFILFLQVDPWGRVRCLQEICVEDARIADVAREVKAMSFSARFRGFEFIDCGDPAGSYMGNAAQEDPEYTILQEKHEIDVQWEFMANVPTKFRVKDRITVINEKLGIYIGSDKTAEDGPALLVDVENCPKLDEALSGGYCYQVDSKGEVTDTIMKRHPYIDAVDCLGYGILFDAGDNTPHARRKQSEEEQEDDRENAPTAWGGMSQRC